MEYPNCEKHGTSAKDCDCDFDDLMFQYRVRLSDSDAELARLRAEVEKLRTMVDTMTQTNDEMFKLYEERGAEVEKLRERKDGAYLERNRVVAALAKCFPSGTARTAIEGWSDDWHGCVYIDLPTGQVSWHFNDAHADLFADLPPYSGSWDGHDTDEKYRRLAALTGHPEVEKLRADVVWAVRHGACAGYDGSSWPCITYAPNGTETYEHHKMLDQIEYNGTDASLLSEVRRAREERTDGV